MDEKRLDERSLDTINALNDERLRRSEENARGWRRNMVVLLLLLMAAFGYWFVK